MSTTAALAESVALAEQLGVDPEALLDVTGRGAIGALYTDLNGTAMAQREFPLRFPLALAYKDAALAVEAAADPERLAVLAATRAQFARAVELGHGARDWAAVVHAALAD
jgi:3-hydroxyisobutyrate dehydrogenase